MVTVTVPKIEYEILKKRASLYEKVIKPQLKGGLKFEDYSALRIREFLKEDRIDKKTFAKLRKMIVS